MNVSFPFGKKGIIVDIPDRNLLKLVRANEKKVSDENAIIKYALEHPINSKPLEKLNGKTVIVVDDKTRPLPTKKILPHVLEKLKNDVTIMFATGTHTPMSQKDVDDVLGKTIAQEYEWVSHCQETEFVDCGFTRFGTPLFFNATYANAEVKIIVGDIEYHYFAGYGGGRKSILPGIASIGTIQSNHKRMFHEKSCFGILDGNPVHDDMREGADIVGVDLCINVVMNSHHQIVGAYAGDHDTVLQKGVKLVDEMYSTTVSEYADAAIIAADGFPHDINLYQAMKAIQTAIGSIKEGGTLVLVAECKEGHGSDKFYNEMGNFETSDEIKQDLLRQFVMGKHKIYYMLRAAERVKMYTVTDMDGEMTSHFGMEKIDESEILDSIYARHGTKARIIASPHASTTLVRLIKEKSSAENTTSSSCPY